MLREVPFQPEAVLHELYSVSAAQIPPGSTQRGRSAGCRIGQGCASRRSRAAALPCLVGLL